MDTTHEPKPRPSVGVGVMIMHDGKILLGKRKGSHGSSTYGWCGGHLEFGETLEECAVREVLEETGLVITSLKLLCVSNIRSYNKHYIDFEFVGEVNPGDPQVLEPDSVESWGWYKPTALPSPLFKAVELAINSYFSGQFYNPD